MPLGQEIEHMLWLKVLCIVDARGPLMSKAARNVELMEPAWWI